MSVKMVTVQQPLNGGLRFFSGYILREGKSESEVFHNGFSIKVKNEYIYETKKPATKK